MLDLECSLHAELGVLLDLERLVLERIDGTRSLQVDDYVWAALNLQTKRKNNAFARVTGVGDGVATTEAKGLLPLAEGLVVLVC